MKYIRYSDNLLMIPRFSIPSTNTNNPPKKNKVSYSTFANISSGFFLLKNIKTAAPRIAIIASPI